MASSVTPEATSAKLQHEPLLDQECTQQFMGEKGITTISFLRIPDGKPRLTRDAFVDLLKGRIAALCYLNPWILGSLVRDKARHRNVQLRFAPDNPSEAEIDRVRIISDDPSLCSLSQETPAGRVVKAVASSSAVVEKGTALVKDPAKRVCRITLCPMAEDPAGVSLIFSLSHTVADGHTYYKLLQQLFEADGPDESLSCRRKQSGVAEFISKGNGEKHYKFLFRPALLMNLLGKWLRGSRAKPRLRYIDEEKVAKAKEGAKEKLGRAAAFVSTNDILTSSFGIATRARVLLMAINWRTRIASLKESDAGNYESCIIYDPESYENAYRIRESLSVGLPIQGMSGRRLPSGCETMSCRIAMITNWAFPSFKCECLVKSGGGTTLSIPVALHLPVLQTEEVPMNAAIIFRAQKNRLAGFYCLTDTEVSDLIHAGAPLGEEIK